MRRPNDSGVSSTGSTTSNGRRSSARSGVSLEDLQRGEFRAGLRVKGVVGMPGCFEMSWAADGRAIFTYAAEVREGERHVVWLAVGGTGGRAARAVDTDLAQVVHPVDTVNRALAEVAARPRRLAFLDELRNAQEDLGDADVMQGAWR